MKIKNLVILPLLIVAVAASAQVKKKKAPVAVIVQDSPAPVVVVDNSLPRPKLVVGLVVDQMRWDYLYRFFDRYQSNGFKRLLNEGFTCENTQVDYIPTFTGPGHTCIYTGSVPSIHGIAGNDYIVQAPGKSMDCAQDD